MPERAVVKAQHHFGGAGRPHITTVVGPERYLYGLRRRLAHSGTAPAEHANHKGFDEGWLGLVGLAGLLGLKRRDRDEAKPGEVNRSDVSRGAASRV